jgi:hypothetical protein
MSNINQIPSQCLKCGIGELYNKLKGNSCF